MTIYSQLFFAGPVSATATTTLFTVPGSGTTILRDVELTTAASGSSNQYVIGIINATKIVVFKTTAGWESHQWTGRVVLPPNAVIACAGNTQTADVWLSGYYLT